MSSAERDVQIRELTEPDELAGCGNLYRAAFAIGAADAAINTRLLVGIVRNSGIVVGAFKESELVGFALSFLAQSREGTLYQYSQNAAVAPAHQGQAIGRRLKFAQRAIALGRGVRLIRWAFDPLQARNAHFNLNVLGARGISIERNFYGRHANGLGEDATTHRMIVEWQLDEPRVVDLCNGAVSPADATPLEKARRVTFPDSADRLSLVGPDSRETLISVLEDLIAEGWVAIACRRDGSGRAAYEFQAREYETRD